MGQKLKLTFIIATLLAYINCHAQEIELPPKEVISDNDGFGDLDFSEFEDLDLNLDLDSPPKNTQRQPTNRAGHSSNEGPQIEFLINPRTTHRSTTNHSLPPDMLSLFTDDVCLIGPDGKNMCFRPTSLKEYNDAEKEVNALIQATNRDSSSDESSPFLLFQLSSRPCTTPSRPEMEAELETDTQLRNKSCQEELELLKTQNASLNANSYQLITLDPTTHPKLFGELLESQFKINQNHWVTNESGQLISFGIIQPAIYYDSMLVQEANAFAINSDKIKASESDSFSVKQSAKSIAEAVSNQIQTAITTYTEARPEIVAEFRRNNDI